MYQICLGHPAISGTYGDTLPIPGGSWKIMDAVRSFSGQQEPVKNDNAVSNRINVPLEEKRRLMETAPLSTGFTEKKILAKLLIRESTVSGAQGQKVRRDPISI